MRQPKDNQPLSVSEENNQLLLPQSPQKTILGNNFDPVKYTEKVWTLNGGKTPILQSKFPPTLVQNSGNLVGESP